MFLDIMSVEERDDEAGVDHDEVGFDHEEMKEDAPFSHEDLYFDAFGDGSNTPIITDPSDGLPRPADDWIAPAPKLSVDKFVCIEDESEYVEVFLEDVGFKSALVESLVYRSEEAREILKSRRSKYDKSGKCVTPRRFKPEMVREVFGIKVAEVLGGKVVVAPKRQRCSHLVRQITVAEDIHAGGVEVRPIFTWCKAFKSTSGSYLSLMDKAILSCEHRNPRDLVTENMIVDRIRKKVKEGEEREQVKMMKDAPPMADPFEGEARFDKRWFEGHADPRIAPGVNFRVTVGQPSAYDGEQEHVLYVGKDISRETFARFREDVGVHTFYISAGDYAPDGVDENDLAAFCEAWPSFASFPYLSSNLVQTPIFLKGQLLRGENLYVCAKDERDAMFAFCLIKKALGRDVLFENLRPEHVHYLNRKEKLCQTKVRRESPSSLSISSTQIRSRRIRRQLLRTLLPRCLSRSTPPSTLPSWLTRWRSKKMSKKCSVSSNPS